MKFAHKVRHLEVSRDWLMASIIAFVFPYMSAKIGGGNSFLIFTVMMTLQLVFVLAIMPETKGKSLEELESKLEKSEKGGAQYSIVNTYN